MVDEWDGRDLDGRCRVNKRLTYKRRERPIKAKASRRAFNSCPSIVPLNSIIFWQDKFLLPELDSISRYDIGLWYGEMDMN